MEMTGAGKLGGHIEWIRSNEIGNAMASLDGIRNANKHVGFISLFPVSGASCDSGERPCIEG